MATLPLPARPAYEAERVRYFDEVMTFRPAHALVAHRPLGGVMRARIPVCKALSDFRRRKKGIAAADTARIEEIPR